jgi:hypothetical protein
MTEDAEVKMLQLLSDIAATLKQINANVHQLAGDMTQLMNR